MATIFINPYLLHIYYTKYEYITLFANYCIIRFIDIITNIEYSIFQYLKIWSIERDYTACFYEYFRRTLSLKNRSNQMKIILRGKLVRRRFASVHRFILPLKNTERNNFQRKGGISNNRNFKQFRVGYRNGRRGGPRNIKYVRNVWNKSGI